MDPPQTQPLTPVTPTSANNPSSMSAMPSSAGSAASATRKRKRRVLVDQHNHQQHQHQQVHIAKRHRSASLSMPMPMSMPALTLPVSMSVPMPMSMPVSMSADHVHNENQDIKTTPESNQTAACTTNTAYRKTMSQHDHESGTHYTPSTSTATTSSTPTPTSSPPPPTPTLAHSTIPPSSRPLPRPNPPAANTTLLSHIPPLLPPINTQTLRELDLDAILRSPQLRHDLLFDPGLQFRPTTSKKKRENGCMYWQAVRREVYGGGCTCWKVRMRADSPSDKEARCELEKGAIDDVVEDEEDEMVCICPRDEDGIVLDPPDRYIWIVSGSGSPTHGKNRTKCKHRQWITYTVRTPSRIKLLIRQVVEIVVSVVRHPSRSPVAPPPPSPSSSRIPVPVPAQNQSQPQVPSPAQTQADISHLLTLVDTRLIMQELKRGIYDPSGLFQLIGGLLKSHCAPMRDGMVDSMVRMATTGLGGRHNEPDPLRGLKSCLEVLEVMKLDIANHQLCTLRPFLVASAREFELGVFNSRFGVDLGSDSDVDMDSDSDAAKMDVEPEVTSTANKDDAADGGVREWLYGRSVSGECNNMSVSQPQPHLDLRKWVMRRILDLVFDPPSELGSVSPFHGYCTSGKRDRSSQSSGQGRAQAHGRERERRKSGSQRPRHARRRGIRGVPDTLGLDLSRLCSMAGDVADVVVVYSLLGLFVQLVSIGGNKKIDAGALEKMKKEICVLSGTAGVVGLCGGGFGVGGVGGERWEKCMPDIVLQIARRVCEARAGGSTPVTVPDQSTLNLVSGWVERNLGSGMAAGTAGVCGVVKARVMENVLGGVERTLGWSLPPPSPSNPVVGQTQTQQGPDVIIQALDKEVASIVKRLGKLVELNWAVYESVYRQSHL